MSILLRELIALCAEMRSEKLTTRNKASERLDNILTNSKTDLFVLFQDKSLSKDISWTDIFNCAIHATVKHSAKLEESQGSRNAQSMRNKNHVYAAIVTKLVDYSLEDRNNFLSKSTLLSAFFDGFSNRSVFKCFGTLFLYVLDTGIYKSEDNVNELKVNEFSRILSYLFEIKTDNDETLRFAVLRAINRTIELSERNVQLTADLIDYLPEVKVYACSAIDDRCKAEIIKLFHMCIVQLSLDYHISVCTHIQEVLPIICEFYNFRMRTEVKETFFTSVVISLTAIYPHFKSSHCNPINLTLSQHWNKTLKKIEAIIETEIKERRTQLYRSVDVVTKRCFELFIEMSALIVYLKYWHNKSNMEDLEDVMESRRKVQKVADNIEVILGFVQTQVPTFNETWLAILAELLNTHHHLINSNNHQELLETIFQILCVYENVDNLKYIKICILSLLRYEQDLKEKNIPTNFCDQIWTKLVEFVISDNSTNSDIINEKQLLIQSLIIHNKLSLKEINMLLHSFLINKTMKRTECIATVRQILINADCIGIDKTSELVGSVLKWICVCDGKIDAKSVLLNIEPIDFDLIADTIAIAAINFLTESENLKKSKITGGVSRNLMLLLYKYNRKYVCIEEHGSEIKLMSLNHIYCEDEIKNCLFQSNYELIMRELNFATTKETSPGDILLDLSNLQKLVCLMNILLKYKAFSEDNYSQCPLMKRIGFFLSHLEFQLKNNDPKYIDRNDLLDILQRIKGCFLKFTSNANLLNYIEAQPLEELISFVDKTLIFSVYRNIHSEFEDFGSITCLCLEILAILCGSIPHYKDTFVHILKHKFTLKADFNNLIVLIKIFCTQKQKYPEVATWFVDKLKIACQLYHNNKEISISIVEILPAIFKYVQNLDEPLQNMLIILSSLLKKTYKKSYSTRFGAKLMESVRLISQNCARNSIHSDFRNICMSVTKFISSSSLEVQFAAINTITALMDFKWFCAVAEPSVLHLNFCEELIAQIDYKNLVTTTMDNNLNSISVTTQLLVSIFVFSSYHQETAIEELSYFCASRKLNESNFFQFQQIAAYFDCTLSELTAAYVPKLVQKWTENKYSISKLPYFLCSNEKENFYAENISIITTCTLLHYKVNELKDLEKYKTQGELIELAIPSMLALIVSFKAGCWSADKSNYSNYIKNLITNLNLLGVDISRKTGTNTIDWRTLFYILELYSDACHFQKMFGFSLCSLRIKWYNIDNESLLNCFRYYISNCCMIKEKNECAMFSLLISKHSLILVRVLTALKKKTCDSVFLIDKLKSFHVYSTFAKLIIDSIESDKTNISTSQSSKKYFIRDVIYYLLHILQDSIGDPKLQCAALTFFHQILSLSVVSIDFYSEILKSNLNFIIKALVSSAKRNTHKEVRQSSINAVFLVMNHCKEHLNDALPFLDDLPISENSDKLRFIQKPMLLGEAKNLKTIVKFFLETQNRGTECLIATRNFISNNKSQFPLENSLIYDFIKRLIEITCNSSNDALTMEAAKCLGEIGALKFDGFSYYFETDISFYRTESVQKDPMEYFIECLLNSVENILLNNNKKTLLTVCLVCEQLVNSRNGIKILNSLSYLNVFHHDDSHKKNYLNSSITMESIDVLTILKNTVLLSYEQWICNFVSKLYSFFGWKDFEELCRYDTIFAETSLIPLFKILVSKKDVHLVNILAMLDYFFNEVLTAINGNTFKLGTIYKEKRIIKHFLHICECVRISNEWNLPVVNLLHVAKACNYCQAYFLAILYLEMWSVQEKNKESRQTSNDIISNELFQEISLKAYESIGCCEAISGFLNPIKSRLEFLNIEGTWSDVMLHADATGLSYNSVCVSNLKKNGLLSLANLNQNPKSIDYEICWRLCRWDTIVEGQSKINTLNDMEQEFKKHHFNSLKCIYKREEKNSLSAITKARNCVVSILKEISLECLQSVYKYLTWLQLLQQVEDFCQVQFTSSKEVEAIFQKWKIEAELEYGNFFCKEQILSHQATLFKTAGIRANRKVKEYYQSTDPLELYLLKCIKSCIHAGEINLASRNIAVLKNMKLSNEHIQVSVLLKDAEVCLKIGKPLITKAILEHLIKKKEFAFCLQRVKAYRMYGEYLMESNTETFESVLSKYFKGSIDLLNQFDKNKEKILLKNAHFFQHGSFIEFERKNRKHAYESIAKYADREYTQLNIYSNSDAFQMKCKIIQENRQAADLIGKQNKDRDKNIGAIFMKKFANLDEKEILSVKQKRTDNLCIAIESYMKFCIIDQSITSPAIYRIIALWFANKQNESLHSKIAKDIGEIPSYKFVCALNQMTARLNSKNQDFILLLRDILVRCAQDHPHHTLYQLLPLVNAFSDSSNSTGNDRVSIAKDIINRSKNKSNIACIKQLETMFPALIDFANENTSESKISISENLRRLKNLDAVQCPTVELTVTISKAYNITSVVKWEDKVVLVGGINAPKKLTCLCSDGIKRSQLLKAKDDLRQDAVMQQVFSMINDLLRSETETNQRKLKLRIYKVVPLSMRSGILEWCQNTIPIGVYLSGDGKSGAHKKYRPNDYTIQKCRSLSMQHLKSDADKRLQIFMHICSNIQPVLHYFFFEKFLVPGEWFERRLAYINSVATTSIVGFVLGLGDRHTQNILIDESTAEVIHIDFGIAFEQGKIMPTPETVPFRLTRDMVAPMGVCETNGLFKKSCEAMMRTLRRNQAVITTILEVLLFDPLYIWKVVPQAVDDCSSEQTNLTAKRALLCVQNKLEGKQTGIFGISDIDVQVQRLINDAILSQNLCLLYPGWDPYL